MPEILPPGGGYDMPPEWGNFNKVSKWPHPLTPRTSSWFLFASERRHFHQASRFIVRLTWAHPFMPLSGFTWFYLDMDPIGPGHCIGSTGDARDGSSCTVEFEQMEVLPVSGVRGVLVTTSQVVPPDPVTVRTTEYPDNSFPDWYYDVDVAVPVGPVLRNPDWSDPWPTGFWGITYTEWYSMSECYDFTPYLAPPVVDTFATFNGVDTYLQLDGTTPFFGWPSKIECDVRFRSLNRAIFLGHNTGGSYSFYIHNNRWHFSGNNALINPLPALDTWLHMEFERGWRNPASGARNLRFDDVLVSSFQGANFAVQANRIGGNIPVPPTMWADMDLRNLTIDNGDVNNPNLILDMPLVDNACDVGPFAFKGTTFNMDLPSCPP